MDLDLTALGIALIVGVPSLVLLRFLLTPAVVSLEDLFTRPDLAWPRGVQEEDVVPWRIERLTPARRHVGDPAPSHTRAGTAPTPAASDC